jgi:hypothetical protein
MSQDSQPQKKEKERGIRPPTVSIITERTHAHVNKKNELLEPKYGSKSRSRTRLTDENLERWMRIRTTDIERDIDGLSKQKQCQVSH